LASRRSREVAGTEFQWTQQLLVYADYICLAEDHMNNVTCLLKAGIAEPEETAVAWERDDEAE
jgi:hypothetical protein